MLLFSKKQLWEIYKEKAFQSPVERKEVVFKEG